MTWRIAKQDTHWIDIEHTPHNDTDVWEEAGIKWDRCVHYRQYSNMPKGEGGNLDAEDHVSYLHICSVADMVDHMLTILKFGSEHVDTSGFWGDETKKMEAVLRKHGFIKP